jgi:hypothetical protein
MSFPCAPTSHFAGCPKNAPAHAVATRRAICAYETATFTPCSERGSLQSIEAPWLALPLRPVAALGQDEEPGMRSEAPHMA